MINSELQERARRLEPQAVEEILNVFYPIVYRIAVGLTGRPAAGEPVVRRIMRKAIDRMPRWTNDGDPQRWFSHHTVLAARRAAGEPPAPMDDALVTAGDPSPPAQYVAFIRALRRLPVQQREAILLHDAEQLDARSLAVAMDCSTEAASNHLASGRRELMATSGDELNRLLAAMRSAYHRLTPADDLALPLVKRVVRRVIWPRRIASVARAVIVLAALSAAIWAVWIYGPMLDW